METPAPVAGPVAPERSRERGTRVLVDAARVGKGLQHPAIERHLGEVPFRVPLHAKGKGLGISHLHALDEAGVACRPGPGALVHAQDKAVMRARLGELGVPCPRNAVVDDVKIWRKGS